MASKQREVGLEALAEIVQEAESALLETLASDTTRDWSPQALQRQATNGWSAAIVSIAFWQLVSEGRLLVDEQLRVHPVGTAA